MRISIEDYESRALDYVEGNLPADELPAFEAFLSEHSRLGARDPFDARERAGAPGGEMGLSR